MERRTHGMGQSGGAATKQKKAMQTTAGRGPDNDKQTVDGGAKKKKKNRRAGYSIFGQVENHARATSLASFQLNQSSRNMVVVSGLKVTLSRAASWA